MPYTEISDLDMEAFVDGLLDDDPVRKAEVEALLQARPDLAMQVRNYRDQSEALRAAYAPILREPVPRRLYDLLHAKPPSRFRRLSRAIAVGAVSGSIAGLAVATWIAAGRPGGESAEAQQFLALTYQDYVRTAGAISGLASDARGTSTPSDIAIPDLSADGFRLTGHEIVDTGPYRLVKASYADADGARFSLYLRPRQPQTRQKPEIERKDGVTLAYWPGSGATALVSRMPADQARSAVQAVGRALSKPSPSTSPQDGTAAHQNEASLVTESLAAPVGGTGLSGNGLEP